VNTSQTHIFLAIDLGAESGRAVLVTLAGGQATMEEIHRWPNRPVPLGPTLHWDVPFLLAEMLQALRTCAARGVTPEGISVDTWGVDFALLDSAGTMVGNPVHYRDGRTENIHDYSDPIMSRQDVFAATGYEPWAISSLFQLLAMQRDGSAQLAMASTFLNMADLFHYFLTGVAVNERSTVNTGNLLALDGGWAESVIEGFSLRREMFGTLVEPASVVGPLSADVAARTGMAATVPVIATCGHDTSAVAAAVPASGENWAFISCGTWSILGTLIDAPVATPRCLELGFTNQYTLGGWYVARNISGLWLVQELRRKWDTPDDPWDYTRLTDAARAADSVALVDAAAPSLMAPLDMEQALGDLISASSQPAPATRGELVRCVLESLALEYAVRLNSLAEITGRPAEAVYIVGGGIHNTLLCQLTADACNLPLHAGADQCTAMGNALGQALAVGVLDSPQAIRQVMRRSFDLTTYAPCNDQSPWDRKREQYRAIRSV